MVVFALLLIISCNENNANDRKAVILDGNKIEEALVNVNKRSHTAELFLIRRYVSRRNWKMTETGTGLQLLWINHGNGPTPKSGEQVQIEFEISLLDGTPCYSSKESGPEWFTVDYDQVESGMHEAIKYLKCADRVILIIPSYRAFGLAGDLDKIPGNNTVVYDLTLLQIR
jgi:FKBP-type peptidyl-prolyl cis-trans isomerase FkpA